MFYRLTGKYTDIEKDKIYTSLVKAKVDAYKIAKKTTDKKSGVYVETPVRMGVWKSIGFVSKDEEGDIVWTAREGAKVGNPYKMRSDGTVIIPEHKSILNNELTVPYYIAKQDYNRDVERHRRAKEEMDRVCEKNPKSIKCKIAKGKRAKAYVRMKHSEKTFERAKNN